MKIDIRPGKYVVAVSGGVDSMVLLDMLARMASDAGSRLLFVVAHFDHGIREDSDQDQQMVAAATQARALPYIYEQGFLGADASEAQAREARYAFLRRVQAEQGADAIVTAHHQDDVLETAVINMIRGTGSRGLGSLRSTGDIVRPLLGVTKRELHEYAKAHNVAWQEDSTNQDERYLRNYIRRQLMPKLTPAHRVALLSATQLAANLNEEIEQLLMPYINSTQLDRRWFVHLPHQVAAETMAAWLRHNHVVFDRKTVERLVVFAKTGQPGKRASLDSKRQLAASKEHITLVSSL
jgi:tRNA(Ile)-lysidine synthase